MTSPVATKAASCPLIWMVAVVFFYFSIGHLGSDRTFPYQVVQTAFLRRALYFRLIHIGGADGLVGFLRSFRFGMELAALDVTFAHEFLDDSRAGIDTQRRQIDRVRTHVGDASGFIQALGYHHGLRHGKTEFVGRFLLQRGSGERSRPACVFAVVWRCRG